MQLGLAELQHVIGEEPPKRRKRAREGHMEECRNEASAIRQWLLQRGSARTQDLLTRMRSLHERR